MKNLVSELEKEITSMKKIESEYDKVTSKKYAKPQDKERLIKDLNNF